MSRCADRKAWLQERRRGVGASEVPAILGVDPRRGPLAVYADKVAADDGPLPEHEAEYLTFGRDVETAIGRGLARRTGRELLPRHPYEIARHPDLRILGATLDFEWLASERYPAPLTAAGAPARGPGALEAKAVGFHRADEWAADPPLWYVVQVQVQMACRGLEWGTLGALMGGIQIAEPVDLVPDVNFMAEVLEAVARFWWHVENRQPPEADALPATRAALRRLWPNTRGAVAWGREELDLVDEWQHWRELAAGAKDEAALLVNRLALRLGPAEEGFLPDGSSFRFKVEDVPAVQCKGCGHVVKRAGRRRVPRRWWPKGLRPRKVRRA